MQESDSTPPVRQGGDRLLRLILACPACQLQFDASRREPGSSFHCGCGTLITVPEVATREESAVIRCSSCGAPKKTIEGTHCSFCGAKFTIHERDLNTICPNCVARISSKARYCHHCGISIVPQRLREVETSYACPCCSEHRLNSRKLGEDPITVLECSCCGGLWLGHEVFELLQKKARTQEIPWLQSSAGEIGLSSRSRGPLYRNCCICGKHMSRRNFAQRSGVVVDICPEDGIWFDQGELEQILKKIKSGELSRVSQDARTREREREILRRVKRAGDPLERAGAEEFGSNRGEGPAPDFVRGVIELLFED